MNAVATERRLMNGAGNRDCQAQLPPIAANCSHEQLMRRNWAPSIDFECMYVLKR